MFLISGSDPYSRSQLGRTARLLLQMQWPRLYPNQYGANTASVARREAGMFR